jgi:hypothetical protein
MNHFTQSDQERTFSGRIGRNSLQTFLLAGSIEDKGSQGALNWRTTAVRKAWEAIRRLIEIALSAKSKRQSNRGEK